MAKQTLSTIKNWFKTSLKPTQEQFWDTWDSFWHKDETIPLSQVEDLPELINNKAEHSQLVGKADKTDLEAVEENINTLIPRINSAEEEISILNDLKADKSFVNEQIEYLQETISNKEHFRGYYFSASEISEIENFDKGDFAYNAGTGTKWLYDEDEGWVDTGIAVPDQTVPASNISPLMDSKADTGISNEYARGDHRHPSDDTKVDKISGKGLSSYDFTSSYRSQIDINKSNIDTLEKKISEISGGGSSIITKMYVIRIKSSDYAEKEAIVLDEVFSNKLKEIETESGQIGVFSIIFINDTDELKKLMYTGGYSGFENLVPSGVDQIELNIREKGNYCCEVNVMFSKDENIASWVNSSYLQFAALA